MYRIVPTLLIYGLITIAFADSATQTDWFYGPGYWGPSSPWGSAFCQSINVSWGDSLSLGMQNNPVDEDTSNTRSINCADIDNDGDMDIIGSISSPDAIIWWENMNGSGESWTRHVIVQNQFVGVVHTDDIDADVDMDVLSVPSTFDRITWWENLDGLGASWEEHTIDEDIEYRSDVKSGDIDGNGHIDVVSCSKWGGYIAWWENLDGSGTMWTKHILNDSLIQPRCLFVGHINGDDHLDILGYGTSIMPYTDELSWWENLDGSGTTWEKHDVVVNAHYNLLDLCLADLNNDGYQDILAVSVSDDLIVWWENLDGSGLLWTEHRIDEGNKWGCVYSADINDDGFMDVITSSYLDDRVTWWENQDVTGTSWIEHPVGMIVYPNALYCEDIDGNGSTDIVSGGFYKLTWWTVNEGYDSNGVLHSTCLYLQNDPGWGGIDWTSTEPSGTSVSFQVRACDSPDSTEMGAWSDTLHSPGSLSGILNEYDSFFQYRVILQTSDSCITPVLEDVSITWNPVGIEGGPTTTLGLLPITPNPSSGLPVVRFSLLATASVELAVYDMSGRILQGIKEDEYSSGYHDIQLEELSPGIYFCRMTTGEFTATQRFVVIQ